MLIIYHKGKKAFKTEILIFVNRVKYPINNIYLDFEQYEKESF